MKFETSGKGPAGGLAGEKRRLALLIAGFVVVVGLFVSLLYQAQQVDRRAETRAVEDESASAPALVALPEVDVARLESLVQDRDPADQVVLESAAADLLLDAARRYTPRHFAALPTLALDAEQSAAIAADPAAWRAKPFLARGRIDALRERTGAAHEQQFLGRLRLQDESIAHFLVLDVPEHSFELGGFVRVDGLFLKVYRTEDEAQPGTWLAGPLLLGPKAVRSYPAAGKVEELDGRILAEVEDADLAPGEGEEPRLVRETPFAPLWHLMAFARDLPAGAVDWQAAPVVDQRLLDEILERPAEWRARPVQIPISRLQDARVRLAGENPARIERYTEGWIGNTSWKSVIQFKSPVVRPDLRIGDLVWGQGLFLHDFAYESSERGLRVAPVFVLSSLERYVPRTSPIFAYIGLSMAALAAFLTILFVVLLRRDRRRSQEFQQELVRRRRARREQAHGPTDTSAATP